MNTVLSDRIKRIILFILWFIITVGGSFMVAAMFKGGIMLLVAAVLGLLTSPLLSIAVSWDASPYWRNRQKSYGRRF